MLFRKNALLSMAVAISALLFFNVNSFAIVGIGGHWNLSNSTLTMSDTKMYEESVVSNGLTFELTGIQGISSPITFGSRDLPLLYATRFDFKTTGVDFGGKAYIDIIPLIDAIEVAFNLGIWEYDGALNYLDPEKNKTIDQIVKIVSNPNSPQSYAYTELPLTLKEYDLAFFGLGATPYAKMNFDLSIKKKIVALPPVVNILKVYAGGGLSLQFATPMLSNKLIESVLEDKDVKFEDLLSTDSREEIGKAIVEKIKDGFTEPSTAMHLLAGVALKFPILPIGFYLDGKYYIPLGETDKNVDLGGMGLQLSVGISLSI